MLRLKLADSTHCGVISEIIGKSFKKQAELLAVKKKNTPILLRSRRLKESKIALKTGTI